MRIPLIGLGVSAFLVGLVVALVSIGGLASAERDLAAEQNLVRNEALDNGVENYVRYTKGLDPLPSSYDTGPIEERMDSLRHRRTIGWWVAGGGAILALVGLATPAAQRVQILPTETDGPPGPEAGSVEQRLATLERLRDAGTITEEEYADKRLRIIDSL